MKCLSLFATLHHRCLIVLILAYICLANHAVNANPTNLNELMTQADELADTGAFEAASAKYKTIWELAEKQTNKDMALRAGLEASASYAQLQQWDLCVEQAKKVLALATKVGNTEIQATASKVLGVAEYERDNIIAAIHYSTDAAELMEDPTMKAKIYCNIGVLYSYQGHSKKAITAYQQAAQFAEITKDSLILGVVYNSLADVYAKRRNMIKAKDYYLKSKTLFDAVKDPYHQMLGISSALPYYIVDSINYAIRLAEEGEIIAQAQKDTIYQFSFASELLKIYTEKGQVTLANAYQQKCASLHAQFDLPSEELAIYAKNYSELLLLEEKEQLALEQAKEAVIHFRNAGDVNNELVALNHLADLEDQLGKSQDALKTLRQYFELKESLQTEVEIAHIATLDSELKDIEARRTVEELNMEKRTWEAEKRAWEAERREAMIVGGGTLFFVLFLLGALWQRQRKNRLISKQNVLIQDKNLQLEQLNHTKDRIFSILGHDLRKPIIAFRGISKKVNYLIDKQDYNTLNLLGEEIERDADNLNKLTDNLLNWALAQKGVISYDPKEVNLAEIVGETVSIFERVISEKSLSLGYDIPKDMWVLVDQNALMTIVRNLVDNAIKYTPTGGQIKIYAEHKAEGIQIQVEDSGVGISEDRLDKLFLLEKDKSQKGTEGEKGVGLGLHLIYELIRINKGKIDVRSTLQKGTTFQILLPTVV